MQPVAFVVYETIKCKNWLDSIDYQQPIWLLEGLLHFGRKRKKSN